MLITLILHLIFYNSLNNLLNKQGSPSLKLDVQEVGTCKMVFIHDIPQLVSNILEKGPRLQNKYKYTAIMFVCISYVICPRVFNKNNKSHL